MITLDVQPSRIYLRGDTFSAKDAIKSAGGHWDADQPAWWLGKAKRDEAERIANSAPAANGGSNGGSRPADAVTDSTIIRGKAAYKGKSGYLILWMGTTSRGEAAKLAFRDGSKIFWADRAEITIEKTYHDREYRGRTEPGMTFGQLNRLAEEYRNAKRDGIEPCHKCGGIHRDTERSCYMCGCSKCEGAHGGLCEDD